MADPRGTWTLLPLLVGCAADPPLSERLGLTGPRWDPAAATCGPGCEVRTTSTLSMTEGEFEGPGPARIQGKMSLELREVVVLKALSDTRAERLIEEQDARFTMTVHGEADTTTEVSPLRGLPLLGDATEAGGWRWRLAEGLPTDEQRAELESLSGKAGTRYPSRPVGVGDTWYVDAAALLGETTQAFGSDSPEDRPTGSASVHFAGIGEHGGEPCAELEYAVDDARIPMDDPELPGVSAYFTLRGAACASLETGVWLVDGWEGWLAYSAGEQSPFEGTDPDPKRGFTMLGPVTGSSSSTVEPPTEG